MQPLTTTVPGNGSSTVAVTPKSTLTTSSSRLAKRCLAAYHLRHGLGLIREREESFARVGSAFHLGQELRAAGHDNDDAIHLATASYDRVPEWADPAEWAVEAATVANLLAGHFWRYGEDNLEVVASELEFRVPLINPDTGRASRNWELAGKIDRIVRTPDGRLMVLEYKTTSEDVAPDSEYWLRLRHDQQIRLYVLGARALGHTVEGVLYDVTRKPTISPRQVPITDEQGRKVVLDAEGNRVWKKDGTPRESGDREKGYVLQARAETAEEFGARLLQDIGDRPDFYYARREIAVLDDDLRQVLAELWQQAHQLTECTRRGWWFRHVSPATCSRCDYKDLCLSGISIDPEHPPVGFARTDWTHPELSDPASL